MKLSVHSQVRFVSLSPLLNRRTVALLRSASGPFPGVERAKSKARNAAQGGPFAGVRCARGRACSCGAT
jgi:hypothetical protein